LMRRVELEAKKRGNDYLPIFTLPS
jgi:hypothetical protein